MPTGTTAAPHSLASTSVGGSGGGHHQRERDLMTQLVAVPYDGLQGVAPRGVPVFSNGDDEYFSRQSAMAASMRPTTSGNTASATQVTIDASLLAAAECVSDSKEDGGGVSLDIIGCHGRLTPNTASIVPAGCVLHTCSPKDIIGGGASSLLQYPGVQHPIDEELLAVTGIKWQCVEFGRRWWLAVHGVWLRSIPTAEQIWTTIKRGTDVYTGNPKVSMIKIDNGVTFRLNCESEMMVPDGVASNLAPRAGDLIIWKRAHDIPFGHVAAIVEVGADFVKIAEQNTDFDNFHSREHYGRQDDMIVQFVKNREYGLKASQKHAPSRKSSTTAAPPGDDAVDPDHFVYGPFSATRQHTRIFPLRTTIRRMKPKEKSSLRRGTDGRTHIDSSSTANPNDGSNSNDNEAVTVTYEIIDEDVILGWIRCDRSLVDFSKEDTADMFRAVLSRGSVSREPFPTVFDMGGPITPSIIAATTTTNNIDHGGCTMILTPSVKAAAQLPPSTTRRPLHMPWLDIKDSRTDFFLKRSLTINGDMGPNARASHEVVPDGFYKMDYDFFMRIRNAAQSLHRLAMDATWKVVHASNRNDILVKFFGIPIDLHAHLTESLMREPPACGRFDFGYDGKNIVMFEYNCDSSGALLEASETQGKILDQYNLIANATQPVVMMPTKIQSLDSITPDAAEASSSSATKAVANNDEADDVLLELDIQAPQSHLPPSVESGGSYLNSKMVAYFRSLMKLIDSDEAGPISAPAELPVVAASSSSPTKPQPKKGGKLSGLLENLKVATTNPNSSQQPPSSSPPSKKPVPPSRVIHFMVDDDDEEKYNALKTMDAAQAAGFTCKMCVRLTSFTFSRPVIRQAGKVMSPEAAEAANTNAMKAERLAVSQSPFKHLIHAHDTTSLGPCPRRVYDVDGVEVKLVWKTWSWDTVLKDHRVAVESKMMVEVPPREPHTDIISAAVESAKTLRPRISDVLLNKNIRVFEPFWKAVAGSKALLPTMYAMDPDHENMYAAAFEQTEFIKSKPYLSKPVSGRAGQNIVFLQQDDAAVKAFDTTTSAGRKAVRAEMKHIADQAAQDPLACPEFDKHDVSLLGVGGSGQWSVEPQSPADSTVSMSGTPQSPLGNLPPQTPLETSEGRFHDNVQVYQHRLRLKAFEAEPLPAVNDAGDVDSKKDPAEPMKVYPIFCAWMVDDQFGAVCVREDTSRITKLASMVVPCLVERK